MLLTLSVIDNSTIYLLLEYFSKNKVSEEVVDEFSNISFEDLSVVEDILRGLAVCVSVVSVELISPDISITRI